MVDDMQFKIIGEVALAMLLGGIIGLEREFADKPAGLRTHMLVSGASALMVALGTVSVQFYSGMFPEHVRADPIRIIEAIVTGISFLGAGTIILRNQMERLEGLTTAASILFVSGLGISVALNQRILAIGLTIVVLVVLTAMRATDVWIKKIKQKYRKPRDDQGR